MSKFIDKLKEAQVKIDSFTKEKKSKFKESSEQWSEREREKFDTDKNKKTDGLAILLIVVAMLAPLLSVIREYLAN